MLCFIIYTYIDPVFFSSQDSNPCSWKKIFSGHLAWKSPDLDSDHKKTTHNAIYFAHELLNVNVTIQACRFPDLVVYKMERIIPDQSIFYPDAERDREKLQVVKYWAVNISLFLCPASEAAYFNNLYAALNCIFTTFIDW